MSEPPDLSGIRNPTSEIDSDYSPDPGTTPERAFVESDNHALGELVLLPYTPSRVVAAQSMGLHYGMLTEEESQQYVEKGIYPQAAHDVVIVLWLCSLMDDAEVARASRWPVAAFKKAAEWGDGVGIIHREDERFWKGLALFERIMMEVSTSRTVMKGTAATVPKV